MGEGKAFLGSRSPQAKKVVRRLSRRVSVKAVPEPCVDPSPKGEPLKSPFYKLKNFVRIGSL